VTRMLGRSQDAISSELWTEADRIAKELQKTMLPLEDDVKNEWAVQQIL
jgi:hypothetical protein